MKFYAKKNPQETIEEHTNELLVSYDEFMKLYGNSFSRNEKELIKLACMYHDIGKCNEYFQDKISQKNSKRHDDEIPHGFLSVYALNPKLLDSFNLDDQSALYTAIRYHHDRQNPFTSSQIWEQYISKSKSNIDLYLKNYFGEDTLLSVDYQRDVDRKLFFENRGLTSSIGNRKYSYQKWIKYIVIKGMLNRFDWSASGHFICERKRNHSLSKEIKNKFHNNFRPIQQYLLENKNNNCIVVAPTGSGKTEAALLWLDDAKGFFTLPLKVSSNAIYKRVKEIYNDGDNVALLHSDSLTQYLCDNENNYESAYSQYRISKNLSSPLTICTIDQLFSFVYKSTATEHLAATLKYSKLIIDEIQSYSPDIIAKIIYGISIINSLGGKFTIMTATMPPFVYDELLYRKIDFQYKVITDSPYPMRHRLKVYEQKKFDINKIINDGKKKCTLVICNTVKSAQLLYKEISNQCNNVNLLHSKFIKKDRNTKENLILKSSKIKEPCIWISTQIVEASLDIDFDVLYTEMSTADSLLQRMGRCYRSRNYNGLEPNVHIYNTGNGVGESGRSPYDKEIVERSLKYIHLYEEKYFSEIDKQQYIQSVYNTKDIKETNYYQKIHYILNKIDSIQPGQFTKEEAMKNFRAVSTVQVVPEEIYNSVEFQEILSKLEKCKDFKDKLSIQTHLEEYTMNITPYNGLSKENIVRSTISSMFPEINIHRIFRFYNSDIGLTTDKYEEDIYI